MKHVYLSLTFLLFLITLFTLPTFTIGETANQQTIVIETYQEDLTGDRVDEKITLKGIFFSKESAYYHNIWADINGSETKQWKIMYEGGYKPSLQFIDLNHDDVNDIFFQSATRGSGGLYYYDLHTLTNEKVKRLPLPKSTSVTGEFKNGFKASLSIDPLKKPIIIDVSNRKGGYIRLGIYNKSGKLLQESSLMIDPIAIFEPVKVSKSKGYGLKSFQQVSGAYHADHLGTIEALWYFEEGKWIKLKNEWKPAKIGD